MRVKDLKLISKLCILLNQREADFKLLEASFRASVGRKLPFHRNNSKATGACFTLTNLMKCSLWLATGHLDMEGGMHGQTCTDKEDYFSVKILIF